MNSFKQFLQERRLVEVDVGEDYQQLQPGDVVERGDEWIHADSPVDGKWTPFTSTVWGKRIKNGLVPMLYRRKQKVVKEATPTAKATAPTQPVKAPVVSPAVIERRQMPEPYKGRSAVAFAPRKESF